MILEQKINAATRVADYNNELCIEYVITNGSLCKARRMSCIAKKV